MKLPWGWGSRISDELLRGGLRSVAHLVVGDVLDVGCGRKPYEKMLGKRCSCWIGLDFNTTPSGLSSADVFGSALDLPFDAEAFDTILSTQVLEHVHLPQVLLAEVERVLRPGGHLILTAPQTNPLHEEPHDYFRYTCHGLRSLAERAGLHVVEIKPLGGAIATVGQLIVWHLSWLRRVPILGRSVHAGVNACATWVILKLDRFSPIYGAGAMKDTLNWLLVARKAY